jgi:hypothetical protein
MLLWQRREGGQTKDSAARSFGGDSWVVAGLLQSLLQNVAKRAILMPAASVIANLLSERTWAVDAELRGSRARRNFPDASRVWTLFLQCKALIPNVLGLSPHCSLPCSPVWPQRYKLPRPRVGWTYARHRPPALREQPCSPAPDCRRTLVHSSLRHYAAS